MPRTRRPQPKPAESVSEFDREGEGGRSGTNARRTWIGRAGQDAPQRPDRVPGEEAHEIATYTVIDSLATAVGDTQTAKLARDILRQEERMQQFLAKLLPELTVDVAHDEIPVSEIEGPAARTGPRGTPSPGARRAATRGRQAAAKAKAERNLLVARFWVVQPLTAASMPAPAPTRPGQGDGQITRRERPTPAGPPADRDRERDPRPSTAAGRRPATPSKLRRPDRRRATGLPTLSRRLLLPCEARLSAGPRRSYCCRGPKRQRDAYVSLAGEGECRWSSTPPGCDEQARA